jgi:hypothetical protein
MLREKELQVWKIIIQQALKKKDISKIKKNHFLYFIIPQHSIQLVNHENMLPRKVLLMDMVFQ